MKELITTFRFLFRKGKNNGIKILSLGIGLAVGLVLISKVLFEFTYDDFYPDKERIYLIQTSIIRENDPPSDFPQVSGGIALGMKNEIAEVETATRYTGLGWQTFTTPDKKKYSGQIIMADTCFFDVLPRPVLAGDVKDVLSRPMYVMVSETIARNMGGVSTAMGQVFELEALPEQTFVIGGVFEDVPENSHADYDIIVSLVSISRFMWDGTENWDGNERYQGYVKLYPGVQPEELSASIREMQARHQPLEQMKQNGTDIQYSLLPLTGLHSELPETKRMALLLGLLALAMLFTGIMNYILIVLSSLVTRTKEMAVYKSYGATEKELVKKLMLETSVHLFISIVLAVFLIFLFQDKIQELLRVSAAGLFTFRTIIWLAIVCFIVFLAAGIAPSMLYARIPVAAAFRSFKESRRNWKKASLFFQFVATTFLVTLLMIIWKQYNMMINDDPGYAYENVLYTNTSGLTVEERLRVMNELRSMSVVDQVSAATNLLLYGMSGNNVYYPGEHRVLFNIADIDEVDESFFPLMEIPVIEGENFNPETMPEGTCMVNESFARKIIELMEWEDGVVGKNLMFSQHGNVMVCGVFADFRIGSLSAMERRPAAAFFSKNPDYNNTLMIKLHEFTTENRQAVSHRIETLLPDREVVVYALKNSMLDLYENDRRFRDSVIIGGLMTLFISIIGLIGYVKDEISRRKSEIAIRKINGGNIMDILHLFVRDISWLALPSLFFGAGFSLWVARKWLEGFVLKTDLPFILFLVCGMIVLSLILFVVVSSSYHTAKENPVNSLRSE